MIARDRIRVLVIDDSAYSRRTIIRILERSPLIEVVDWARDGADALRKAIDTPVDLITLDLEMPRMNGFTFLRLIMARNPTPVIVISGQAGDEDVFKALELGAVDFVAKPTDRAAPELEGIELELIRKVHAIRQLRIEKVRDRLALVPSATGPALRGAKLPRVVAVGSSTGGPTALIQLFGAFGEPPPFAFVVSQHMPEGFTEGFARRLDRTSVLQAREARPGDEPRPGTILLAPGGTHLEFENRAGRVVARIMRRAAADKYAPSVDRMFSSAAKHFGSELLAVVLTGMGDDGRAGARVAKSCGGRVIAESEETSVVFGMPQQVIREGVADAVLPLPEIVPAIQAGLPRADESEAEGPE
jgi:two-component system chemotaxis response regulator CheB